MNQTTPAEQALRNGDPQEALRLLQNQVRSAPADAKLRVFLFQLLSVLGQWDRALNQLTVAGELDAETTTMVQTYREAIQCERLRQQVFLGQRAPLLMGEPQAWVALFIEALLLEGQGQHDDARRLRATALDEAPNSAGTANGQRFAWLSDADMRIGPVLEAVINGRYYWVPLMHLSTLTIEAPADLRDRVWMPAQLEFTNGGATVALIPTRYAGTDLSDPMLALARETRWLEPTPSFFVGVGQRLFATDNEDIALMDAREIVFDAAPEAIAADLDIVPGAGD